MWFMHLFVIFILLSSHCKYGNSLRPAEKECQKIKKNYQASMGNLIVGGTAVAPGELPYVVALGFIGADRVKFFCAGALVTASCVVTAAHCADRDIPMLVRAGTIDISDPKWNPETDHRVEKKKVHPQFDRNLKYYDIAVLCMDSPIKMSANVSPICLETTYDQPTVPLTTAGWGRTSVNGTSSKILLKATVQAVSRSTCQVSYNDFRDILPNGITPKLLCAGDPKGIQDGCQGDSGSPLMIAAKGGQSIMVGTTSFGRGCGSSYPSVYTRTVRFLDFIEANSDMGSS